MPAPFQFQFKFKSEFDIQIPTPVFPSIYTWPMAYILSSHHPIPFPTPNTDFAP
ncbi:hypothetical protein OIDMADRAFT_19691 [Oidiodendron maius Zn]|uniref:Uncharacterized protein n=1 Tax=Oidiodendron maius (strain Zn) TaxID=913774 RepID=A0A0C3H8H8_OIDMZ|nr:hypothetical protein OIDMADRAFT_19691 [Oidiodendron maius Zn]